MVMEATKGIVSKTPSGASNVQDEFGREPFDHPQLRSVDNLISESPVDTAGKEKLSAFAQDAGLLEVLRWKPRKVCLSYTQSKDLRSIPC